VHLQNSAAQLKEVLAGNVDVGFDNVGGLVKYAQSDDIRILAVMDPERSTFLPDVPTTTELGYPAVISNSSRGIIGPAGLDPAIVKKLQDAVPKVMADPEHTTKLEASGFTVRPMPADEFLFCNALGVLSSKEVASL
jgi:putative tricarboxylic transport membrane protein